MICSIYKTESLKHCNYSSVNRRGVNMTLQCSQCDKEYAWIHDLNRHVKHKHLGQQQKHQQQKQEQQKQQQTQGQQQQKELVFQHPFTEWYVCIRCKYWFYNRRNYMHHLRTWHTKDYYEKQDWCCQCLKKDNPYTTDNAKKDNLSTTDNA